VRLSLRICKNTGSPGAAKIPFALVGAAVRKVHLAVPVAEASEPLAFVQASALLVSVLAVLQVVSQLLLVAFVEESRRDHGGLLQGFPKIYV